MKRKTSVVVSSTKKFHKNLKKSFENFEIDETTVSHRFRKPTIFLNGLSYGEAFFQKIAAHKGKKTPFNVLEIGGGLGYFANSFCKGWQDKLDFQQIKYFIYDISPALIKSQRRVCAQFEKKMKLKQIDISDQSLKFNERFDFIIANEMIADLDVSIIEKKMIYPVGFMRMLHNLRKISHQDTEIFVIEYFNRSGFHKRIRLPGHTETCYDLDAIVTLSENLGFVASVESLFDFLKFDFSRPPISKSLLRKLVNEGVLNGSETMPPEESETRSSPPASLSENFKGFRSSADWLQAISRYYVIRLKKVSASSAAEESSILIKDPNVMKIVNDSKVTLIKPYPFRKLVLSKSQAQIWLSIDNKSSYRELLKQTKGARKKRDFEIGVSKLLELKFFRIRTTESGF